MIAERREAVDALRGLAALSVCWFHLTNGSQLTPGALRSSGTYGFLGVAIFFVISGFVIPLAMRRASYSMGDYPRFLAKRLLRVDPPYLASVALVVVAAWLSSVAPGYRGAPFVLPLRAVGLHIGFLNVLTSEPWLSPVYWSLAIELQYYLAIGLLFPVLLARGAPARGFALAGIALAAVALPSDAFLPHYLFLFLFGIVVFLRREGILKMTGLLVGLAIATVGTWTTINLAEGIAGLLTAIVIVALERRMPAIALWLGGISYSLYLTHVIVGGRVMNLGTRGGPQSVAMQAVLLTVALAACLAAAYGFHRGIERPAQRWASRISYRRTPAAAAAAAAQVETAAAR